MVKVKFFGTARTEFNLKNIEVEAKSIPDLINKISKAYPNVGKNKLKSYMYYINGEVVGMLALNFAKLKDGDEVTIISAVAGG